ncbi:MAG: hypothetical protein ACAI25_08795 [Planctomycetota bacterium]
MIERSHRAKSFRDQLEKLPERVRDDVERLFPIFMRDPMHPMLENHPLKDSKKGRHKRRSHAVTVSGRYRALYVLDRDDDGVLAAVWYWIGTHEDYNNFTSY